MKTTCETTHEINGYSVQAKSCDDGTVSVMWHWVFPWCRPIGFPPFVTDDWGAEGRRPRTNNETD